MGRRGSKPKPGNREPNGQLSRRVAEVASRRYDALEREEVATIAVGIEARERIWGIKPQVSRDQLAGSYIGRLKLQGDLSAMQYDALMMYAEQCHEYRIAMRAPAEPNAVNLNATKGGSGDYENVHKSQDACDTFERALKALRNANAEPSNRGCNLIGSIAATVLRDTTLDHLVNDTRVAANVLARHYGLTAGRKAT